MDTAYHLLQSYPQAQINLVIGKGTSFLNRSKLFPTNIQKYNLFGNTTFGEFMMEHALLFNGDNEDDVMCHFKLCYGLNLDSKSEQCMCGILSPQENDFIRNGIHSVIRDYVVDIHDDQELIMTLRSGKSIKIERQSWIINCTGYLYKHKSIYEPYLTKQGHVLSIQQTSGIMIFPSIGSYFLSSLFFLNTLHTIPYYELDHESLNRKNKNAYIFTAMIQSLYNSIVILDYVPFGVVYDCHLNLDKWYPLYRQIKTVLYIKYYQSFIVNHCRKVLNYVGDKYDVHCGLLDHLSLRREGNQMGYAPLTLALVTILTSVLIKCFI